MIEIGTISEAEFNTGIYYRANLEYLSSNSNFYFINEEQKYFITLKNYIYDNQYDADIIYY
jgi:hypothetical protein